MTAVHDKALVEKAMIAAFHALEVADWDEVEAQDGDITRGLAHLAAAAVLDAVADDLRQQGYDRVLDAVADDLREQGAVTALRDAGDAWTRGAWADAPRRADRAQERIANAQHVGDWLRTRADRIEREHQ